MSVATNRLRNATHMFCNEKYKVQLLIKYVDPVDQIRAPDFFRPKKIVPIVHIFRMMMSKAGVVGDASPLLGLDCS